MGDEFTSVQWDKDEDDSTRHLGIDIDVKDTSSVKSIEQPDQDTIDNHYQQDGAEGGELHFEEKRKQSHDDAPEQTAIKANDLKREESNTFADETIGENIDDNLEDTEGSGLITQTMILGAQDHPQEEQEEEENEQSISSTQEPNDKMTYNEEQGGNTNSSISPPSAASSPDIESDSNTHQYNLQIEVFDPITEHNGSNSFTVYHLKVNTDNPQLSLTEYTIERRYSDFEFLYKCLTFDYPSLLIPPLPNKQRLEYIKGGRFTEEFVTKRCNSLNVFINRVIKHPKLSKSEALLLFLGKGGGDYWNQFKISFNLNSNNINDGKTLTDLLMNSFKKPTLDTNDKFNKHFQEIDYQRLKLQENLNKIDKIYSKIVNKQSNISNDLSMFGNEFNKLIVLLNNDFNGKYRPDLEIDSNTKTILKNFKAFSSTLSSTSSYYLDLNKYIEFNYLNNLKDLEHYLISLGQLIKLKDYKILDYEMLNSYLEKSINERDNLINGGSITSTTEGTINYLTKKLESLSIFKNDQQQHEEPPTSSSSLINERIEKLNSRIKLLEDEKVNAKKVYKTFEKDLLNEWNEFQKIKDYEINYSLNCLTNEYIKFYEKSNKDWKNLTIEDDLINFQNELTMENSSNKYFSYDEISKNDAEIKALIKEINE